LNNNNPTPGLDEGKRYWRRQQYQKSMDFTLNDGNKIQGLSQDVSVSGVFISYFGADEGDLLNKTGRLNVLTNEGEMDFSCQVVRATENGFAVNFLNDQNTFGMFVTHDLTLDLLSEINNLFSQSLDLEATFDTAVSHIKEFMHSTGASLFLLEDTGKIVCRACSGPVDIKGISLDLGEGVVGRTIETGESQVVYDTTTDPNFASKVDAASGFETDSIICAPLKIQNQTFGALEVVNMRGHDLFPGHDRVVLSMLASSTAMAIHNARQAIALAEQEKISIEASAANRAKSEFLSSMSHELRTPLNAILGFGQLLELSPTETLSPTQLEHTRHILKGGKYLLGLIDQVLELSKIESDSTDLSLEHIMPSDIFQECLELVSPMAEERDITMSGSKGEVSGIFVDRTRFRQVILNLMSNAIKYNNVGGKLEFGCETFTNEKVRIYVSDNGPGIPTERQDELFQPFNRLGKENSNIEGTGIGLTITKKLVQAMDGEISFQSDPENGTTFWLLFDGKGAEQPLLSDENSPSILKSAAEEISITGTILYIEDNLVNLNLVQEIISDFTQLKFMSAPNAEIGIEMAKKYQPDMIVMDINLPGMNGITTC
jgi:signal transduction histidine kinase